MAVGARCLWLQLGIANEEAARIAHDGGLAVVMDRCTIVEHRRLVAAARGPRPGDGSGDPGDGHILAPTRAPLPARARPRPMESARCPQIHLTPSPATTRPSCLLPGDPNRATRIAARFDGGLEATRGSSTPAPRLLGYTGTLDGVPSRSRRR